MAGRKLKRVVPVGTKEGEILKMLLAGRIPEDPDFVLEKPKPGEHGTLYLALDKEAYEALQKAGIPCACVTEAQKRDGFPGADILITEPWEIEASSFERIYDRLYHLPWIIEETKRLIIREMTEDDLGKLYRLYDEEAAKYLPMPDPDIKTEGAILKAYIERVYGIMGYGYWAVVEKKTGELIGRAGYGIPSENEEPGVLELGYLIRKDKRNKGYAGEAVQAVISYGKRMLGCRKVYAVTDPANTASLALLEKLGFQREVSSEPFIRFTLNLSF